MQLMGDYSSWLASLAQDSLPRLSYRRDDWSSASEWQTVGRQQVIDHLAMPVIKSTPTVTIERQYSYDGLQIEELSWQLPFGPVNHAIALKPLDAKEPLPGILALHDHATNKYFGKRKIARTSDTWHPSLFETHAPYYGGVAWANEVAKRGYIVLIHDSFSFGSRRIRVSDIPEHLRDNVPDPSLDGEPHNSNQIYKYNQWASAYEAVIAKALFASGTTWSGVFLAEDQIALDILCQRDDVDESQIGCGGLSGGGLRVVFLAGMDSRIQCAVCVAQMTTWQDFALNVGEMHSWMNFSPLLPRDLDYPEVLGLRVPSPTMVLMNSEDQLFGLSGMQDADAILQAIYAKADAPQAYQSHFHSGGHKFDLAMQVQAFDWFDQWLK